MQCLQRFPRLFSSRSVAFWYFCDEIKNLTSHLDISPTINCLFRNHPTTIETQGRAITATAAASRNLYFGGAWYNGSDGYWDGRSFYSYNQQLDMLWASTRFDFGETSPMANQHMVQQVVGTLQSQESFQEALLSNY